MDSENKESRFLICPVCHKVNPAGTKFCEFCWGAALKRDESYSQEELDQELERRLELLKKKKRIKLGIWGGLGVAAVVLLILFFVNYTDILSKPQEELNSNSVPGEWAMFRHDVLRTGSDGETEDLPEGKLKWSFTTNAIVHSSPAVSDGKVFIGSQDNYLYALNSQTGNLEWKFKTGSFVDSSPAVAGGKVYFGSNDSTLYALDIDTGQVVWDFETQYPVRSSPAVAGDTVYFGSDDYYLYAVNAETGKRLWRFDTDSPAGVSPVVDSGIVYIGAAGGFSFAVNAESGMCRLRYNTSYTVYSSAVVDDGAVYFTSTNGVVFAVDQMARTKFREHEIRPYWSQAWAMMPWLPQPPEQSGKLWVKSFRRANTTTPLIDNGIMYLGSDKYIVALDLATQEVLWEFATGGVVRSSPAKAGSVIYAGSDDGNLYAVNAADGTLRWSYDTGARVTSSPAVVDGVVYVGSDNGKVYAIE